MLTDTDDNGMERAVNNEFENYSVDENAGFEEDNELDSVMLNMPLESYSDGVLPSSLQLVQPVHFKV